MIQWSAAPCFKKGLFKTFILVQHVHTGIQRSFWIELIQEHPTLYFTGLVINDNHNYLK